jgi:RNA polymerase sigma-70 factor (ECF subfamily)
MTESLTGHSEQSLVAAAQAGRQDAYAELVRRHSPVAHRTALLIAGPAEAEDAVQEAFVRAFYALNRFRADAPFRPWLLAIVGNCARNRSRSRGQRTRLLERLFADADTHVPELAPSAEAVALDLEARRALVAALERLPDKARQVVTCRYLLDLGEAETAQVLGWPTGTVKSRLSRALDRLRADLDRQGGAKNA